MNDPTHEYVGVEWVVVDSGIPVHCTVTHYDPQADDGEGAITGVVVETPAYSAHSSRIVSNPVFKYTHLGRCGHLRCGYMIEVGMN